MIVHGLEITMFVVGIITLVRGTFNLSAKTVVRGGRAYAIGIIMVVAPLISFGAFLMLLLLLMSENGFAEPAQSDILIAAGVEFGILLLAWVPIIVIGVTQPKQIDPWDIPIDEDGDTSDRPWRRRDRDDARTPPPPLPSGERERIRRKDDHDRS